MSSLQRVFVYQGELLALSAALFWALAVILFRITGRGVRPLSLNLFKTIFCTGLFCITLLILKEPMFPELPFRIYAIMLLSGAIGIGVSDTLFFASLNRLGAGLSAIVNCSYSPLVIILATVFLGERMNLWQLVGVALIITAVYIIALSNRTSPLQKKHLISGITLGIAAMLSMAASIILMKPYLSQTSVIWAALIRTVGGLLVIAVVIGFHSQRRGILNELKVTKNWKLIVVASFLGGYLAFTAWMGGMKFTLASTASALNQMSTVFIFVLGVLFLKEAITSRKITALCLAVAGVLLITFLKN
jgi:uncharacterized membrane protein